LQLGDRTRGRIAYQVRSRDRVTIGHVIADFRFWQQYTVSVVLDRTVIGLPRVAVVAIAVVQNQPAAAIGANLLTTLVRQQYRNTTVLGILAELFLSNEDVGQKAAVIAQFFGVSHPRTITQRLKATGFQGIELGQGVLLVEQQLKFIGALGSQAQAEPGHDQCDQRSGRHGYGQQALTTHAGGRQHGHFAFKIQAAIRQKNAQKQPQRQDQLHEAWQSEPHDQEQ